MEHIQFGWDAEHQRLTREPESPVCEREETMRYATLTQAIRGDDPMRRDQARYEMAMLAYDQRVFYQPCRSIPGGPARPSYVAVNNVAMMDELRDALRILRNCTTRREVEHAVERNGKVEDAILFLDYVRRVSAVESYNETCCMTLLMAHAWLSELNPEGDAAAIETLRALLRNWYSIHEPETTAAGRAAQAKKTARDFRWLRSPWRTLWERS